MAKLEGQREIVVDLHGIGAVPVDWRETNGIDRHRRHDDSCYDDVAHDVTAASSRYVTRRHRSLARSLTLTCLFLARLAAVLCGTARTQAGTC